jgi:dolichyl-phosphate-mannose-protein mannosyltransferase
MVAAVGGRAQVRVRAWMAERLRWLVGWSRTSDGKRLLVLLALALGVRLVLAPFHGFFHDLQAYVTWGRLLDHDFFHFYTVAASTDVLTATKYGYLPNYPPLTVYLYGLMDGAYVAVAHLFTPQPTLSVAASPLLAVYMKLPVCAADLALVGIIYTQARRLRSRRWATIAAASYAFSPTVLFDGALWGQSDALPLLAIMVALLYTLRHRGVPAGVLFAAAVLFKPQPFVFGPLILFYLWRWAGGREALRALAAMAGTGLALCLPFLLPPHPEILVFLRTARDVALVRPFATLDGYNVWWFLGDMHTNVARPLVGPLSATVIGWLLFALAALVVAIGLWRDPSGTRLFLGAALLATAFFDVTTLQRERYLYPALALFLLATIGDVRAVLFYVTVTVTALLNMAMGVLVNANPPDGFPADPGINLNAQSEYFVHHGLPTLAVAAVNVWLLIVVVFVYLRSLAARPAALHAVGNRLPVAGAPADAAAASVAPGHG